MNRAVYRRARPVEAWPAELRLRWAAASAGWPAGKAKGARTAIGQVLDLADEGGVSIPCEAAMGPLVERLLAPRKDPHAALKALLDGALALWPEADWRWLRQRKRAAWRAANPSPARAHAVRAPTLALPLAAWPAELRRRWEAGLLRPSVETDYALRLASELARRRAGPAARKHGPARAPLPPWRWGQGTRRVAERGWGQLLAWRRRRGAAEDAIPHPKELFALADDARARGCTWSAIETYGRGIDLALRLLWPSSRPVWLRECVATFHELAEAERMKRAPVPLVPLEEVYRCGLELMRAGLARTPSIRTTLMIRDGFAIMLLCWRPKRSGNLHRARIGIELRLDEHGEPMDLVFATTKNRDPSETPFPAQLIEAYHLYCDRARRLLDLHGGDALWVGETGGPMTQAGFADAIRRRLEAAFGRRLGPHAFRTFYASSMGGLDPSLMPFVSSMLDHRHPDTADRYYKRSNDAHAAGRVLEAVLGELLPEGALGRRQGASHRQRRPETEADPPPCLPGPPRQAGLKG